MLPDNVDNIRLIIDIDNVAARRGLTLKNVELGDISSGVRRSENAVGESGPVGSVEVGFSVSANYENMLLFLQDLEHSLRILDVESLDFASGVGVNDVNFTLRTYWLH
jgi:hypothetical protein